MATTVTTTTTYVPVTSTTNYVVIPTRMSRNPGAFKDIGKDASDFLNKNFYENEWKVEVNAGAADGTVGGFFFFFLNNWSLILFYKRPLRPPLPRVRLPLWDLWSTRPSTRVALMSPPSLISTETSRPLLPSRTRYFLLSLLLNFDY